MCETLDRSWRMRGIGRRRHLTGCARWSFVVPATADDFARRSREIQQIARDVDWRFYDLSLVAVEKL